MKKLSSLLLIVIMASIFLIACGKEDSNGDIIGKNTFNRGSYITNKGMFFQKDELLYFFDESANKTVLVTSKPNKVDKDESNDAYIGGFNNFAFTHGNKLYTMKQDLEKDEFSCEESSLDRQNIKEVFRLEGQNISRYTIIDDKVYFYVSKQELEKDPNTGIMMSNGIGISNLYQYDFKERKTKALPVECKGYSGEATLIGTYENKLYSSYSEISKEQNKIENDIFITDLNGEGKKIYTNPDLDGEIFRDWWIEKDYLYVEKFTDNSLIEFNISRIDLKTNNAEKVSDNLISSEIVSDGIITVKAEEDEEVVYFIDSDTLKEEKIASFPKDEGVWVMGESEEGYYYQSNKDFEYYFIDKVSFKKGKFNKSQKIG